MKAQGALRLEDVPAVDAPWERIAEFAHTFNDYAHFGEQWGEKTNAVRERYFETRELPDEIDDLRACHFCEFRMDRFTWGDDVTLLAVWRVLSSCPAAPGGSAAGSVGSSRSRCERIAGANPKRQTPASRLYVASSTSSMPKSRAICCTGES